MITLNDGRRIPQLGFGVYQVPLAATRNIVSVASRPGTAASTPRSSTERARCRRGGAVILVDRPEALTIEVAESEGWGRAQTQRN